ECTCAVGGPSRARIVETRGVGKTECFPAALQAEALRELEGAEEAHVQVEEPGAANHVASAGAKPRAGWRRKGIAVEIGARGIAGLATWSGRGAEYCDWADDIRGLSIPRRVELAIAGSNREWSTAYLAQDPVGLPAAQDLVQDPGASPALASAEGQLIGAVETKVVRTVIACQSPGFGSV